MHGKGRTVAAVVEMRVMGEETQVRAVIAELQRCLRISWDGGLRPKRYGDGVRAYVQVVEVPRGW